MAVGFLFSNNNNTTLAGTLSAGDTTGTLALGTGAAFPSPGGALNPFAGILTDAATQTKFEIVYVTNRSGDVITIERGEEGSTAQTWLVGDLFYNGPTAATQAVFIQASHMVSATSTQTAPGVLVT